MFKKKANYRKILEIYIDDYDIFITEVNNLKGGPHNIDIMLRSSIIYFDNIERGKPAFEGCPILYLPLFDLCYKFKSF